MEDSVQLRCTRCKIVFRERAKRLQNGYSRQCPACEVVLFFDEDSPDQHVRRTMRTARRVRKELRQAEAERAADTRSTAILSRRFAGRHQSAAREDD